jgi:hypothetical protein
MGQTRNCIIRWRQNFGAVLYSHDLLLYYTAVSMTIMVNHDLPLYYTAVKSCHEGSKCNMLKVFRMTIER